MVRDECPSTDQIKAFLVGDLHLAAIDEIATHLDDCRTCEDTVTALDDLNDTYLSLLRKPPPSKQVLDEDCRRVMSLVKKIGLDPSFTHDVAEKSDSPRDEVDLGTIRVYELLEKIGEGGMGAVYKARHTQLDKIVALKVLSTAKLQDASAVGRFKREMKAVGRLDHQHIVRAMDAGEDDGKHYLVTEYVKGIDLSDLVRRTGPLRVADACELVRQAALGLQEAHEHGMIHRDIKPSNLMLAARRNKPPLVKILDMGLALLDSAPCEHELTGTGQMMGTLDYMAPEQGTDSHEVDIRADIYSLGATLYKLLTGEAIYHGEKYRSPMQKIKALDYEPAPPVQDRRPEVPDELAAIVHRMIEKDPHARFAAPAEVAEALAPFAAGADLAALAQTEAAPADASKKRAGTNVGVSRSDVDTQSESTPALPSPIRTIPPRMLLACGGAVLGIAAMLAAVVFFLRTPAGTLRVEINDPSIVVQVQGSHVILSKADKEQIKLSPGKHTLIVTRGDFQLETRQIILKKGETTTVKVELLPGKIQVVSAGEVVGEHSFGDTESGESGVRTDNYALEFDGLDDYVETPLTYDGSHPLTVEAYATPRSNPSRRVYAIASNAQGNGFRVWLRGTWEATAYNGGRLRTEVISDRSAKVGRRVHVAGVYDLEQVALFVDGKLVGSTDLVSRIGKQHLPFIIGGDANPGEPSMKFHGSLDEVRISRVARYTRDFKPAAAFEPDGDTLLLYHFDEGAGDAAHDASGNARHGKIHGAKWVKVGPGRLGSARHTSRPAAATFEKDKAKDRPGNNFSTSVPGSAWDHSAFAAPPLALGGALTAAHKITLETLTNEENRDAAFRCSCRTFRVPGGQPAICATRFAGPGQRKTRRHQGLSPRCGAAAEEFHLRV